VNLAIILDSLKFYKLRHDKAVQFWFILLYALNILLYILPVGDRDFSRYFSAAQEIMNGNMPKTLDLSIISPGNWIFLGISLLMQLVNAYFSLLYATLFVGERDAMKPRQAFKLSLGASGRLLLLGLLLVVPATLSACLFFIPVLVFAMMMYFLPLNLALNKQPLTEAMHQSFVATQRQKLLIFIQIVLASVIISLPRDLILALFPSYGIPYILASSFFTVLSVFILGRMMGNLYLFIVKKVPIVIPSKSSGHDQF